MLDWSEVGILFRRELRSALRERSIVVNSILMPIFLYPLLLWGMLSAWTLVEGLSEGFTSRVAVYGLPAEHAAIRDSMAALDGLELVPAPAGPGAAESELRAGTLDAVVVFAPPAGEAAGLEGNFVARIAYDQSEERSRRAQARVGDIITDYRSAWLARESETLGIPAGELAQFEIERVNTASGSEMGAFLLSLMLPLFLVIMVAVGCFYPAIDTTAGERERSTWETLMSVSASRTSVLVAKYLYVATLGIVAGILNVIAMTVSIGAILAPMLGGPAGSVQFTIPLGSIPILVIGASAAALLFAAMMMILASFARTFKDGQAMIMPAYYLALLPVLFVSEPDLELDAFWAAVPIANLMLMMRESFQGIFQWLYIAESLAVVVGLVVLCLALARYILSFEDLLLGSYDGNLWKFIRERGLKRSRPASA